MPNALVVAELAEDGKVKKATLSAITFAQGRAARASAARFSILVLGSGARRPPQPSSPASAPPRSSSATMPRSRTTSPSTTRPTVAEVGKGFAPGRRHRDEPSART